jgi:PKD repeat protein
MPDSVLMQISHREYITIKKGETMSCLKKLFLIVLCCMVLPGLASAAAPTAAFSNSTSTPATGPAPLSVSFTDASTGSPLGWAWFFGDENFTVPWTQMTGGAGWSGRSHQSAVAMPNGSVILTGGRELDVLLNDTWQGTNNGAGWTEVNSGPGWTARSAHSSVVTTGGNIVLMGGSYNLTGGITSDGVTNDTWRSTDYGKTWTLMNASSGWTARSGLSSVAMPDGSIVLMGGAYSLTGGPDVDGLTSDVWRSTNDGLTWTQVSASSDWGSRQYFSSVAMPDGSIVLMGGFNGAVYLNNTWRSTNNGLTWSQVNASSGWGIRGSPSSVAMPDGSIVLMGGGDGELVPEVPMRNDTWRSTDNGTTWTQVNASGGWPARNHHSTVGMPDGSILLMGGSYNDVWRFMPAGSSATNPTHMYTLPGTYQVALQVSNADGYNSLRKAGYVIVTSLSAPVASFTTNTTTGVAPLSVLFNDTSTGGTPTAWNWSFGDGGWFNTTDINQRNTTHSYSATSIAKLTVSNAAGSSTTSPGTTITITTAPAVGTSDAGVFRNSTGTWYLETAKTGTVNKSFRFGVAGDTPVVGDWDHNSVSDAGVFRKSTSTWYLETAKTGAVNKSFRFGISGDTPVVGDWDGNGISDTGVFRNSTGTWYLETAKTGTVYKSFRFGIAGDTPVVGDWDHNGISDVGVFRKSTNTWYLETAKTGAVNKSFRFGISGDTPVVGDWDGNGISDTGVFRNSTGTWYLETAKTGAVNKSFRFGISGDTPVVGDWDGNGISDTGVFRKSTSTWYLETAKTGAVNKSFRFGISGDTPVTGKW